MGGAETEGKDLGRVSLVDGSAGPGPGGTRGVVGWVGLWARWSLRHVQDLSPCGWRGSPPTVQQVWLGACSERGTHTLPPPSPGSCQGAGQGSAALQVLVPDTGVSGGIFSTWGP